MKHLFQHNEKVVALCSEHEGLTYRFFVDLGGSVVDITEELWQELHDDLSPYCAIADRGGARCITANLSRMPQEVESLVEDSDRWIQPVAHIQTLMEGKHEWFMGAIRVVSFDRSGIKVI